MKVTIESTAEIVSVNGTKARVWRGATEAGVAIEMFVPIVKVRRDADNAEFERDLREVHPAIDPGPISMRFII